MPLAGVFSLPKCCKRRQCKLPFKFGATGHHDNQHKDTQHYDTEQNDTKRKDTQQNETQRNGTQHLVILTVRTMTLSVIALKNCRKI